MNMCACVVCKCVCVLVYYAYGAHDIVYTGHGSDVELETKVPITGICNVHVLCVCVCACVYMCVHMTNLMQDMAVMWSWKKFL